MGQASLSKRGMIDSAECADPIGRNDQFSEADSRLFADGLGLCVKASQQIVVTVLDGSNNKKETASYSGLNHEEVAL